MKKLKKSVVKNKSKRKHIIMVLTSIIAVVALIAIFIFIKTSGGIKVDAVVVEINGEAVTKDEFEMFLADERAMTGAYFREKYGIDDNPKFWTSNYDGENPSEHAKKSTLKILTKVKIEQSLAKSKNIITDTSYEAFCEALVNENKRRQDAVKEGKVIYGPIEYGKNQYYSYLHSSMLIKLKEKFGEKDLNTDDNTLRNYYEQIKTIKYKNLDTIKLQKLSISPTGDNYNLDTIRTELKTKISELKGTNDDYFSNIINFYKDNTQYESQLTEQVFNKETIQNKDATEHDIILEEAQRLYAGQISELIETSAGFVILKCIEKKENAPKSFNEVKFDVKTQYINAKYEEMIQMMVEKATIETNKKYLLLSIN